MPLRVHSPSVQTMRLIFIIMIENCNIFARKLYGNKKNSEILIAISFFIIQISGLLKYGFLNCIFLDFVNCEYVYLICISCSGLYSYDVFLKKTTFHIWDSFIIKRHRFWSGFLYGCIYFDFYLLCRYGNFLFQMCFTGNRHVGGTIKRVYGCESSRVSYLVTN